MQGIITIIILLMVITISILLIKTTILAMTITIISVLLRLLLYYPVHMHLDCSSGLGASSLRQSAGPDLDIK